MQRARWIQIAVGDDECCPRESVDGQEAVGCGGNRELGARARREEFGFVQPIELLAVERRDADAKVRVLERGVGKDGLDAARERAGCGRRTNMMLAMRARLRVERKSDYEGNGEREAWKLPQSSHARSLAGQRSIGTENR